MQVVHGEPVPLVESQGDWDELPRPQRLAIVTTRAAVLARELAAAGHTVVGLDVLVAQQEKALGAVSVVADVEEWQSRWSLLGSLRGRWEILLDACSLLDYRTITRSRSLPPPLPTDPAACWRVRADGTVGRARLDR